MSVKLTRHEEKRNTSLRDFLLAATLPLLLVGAIGYLMGASNAGDSEKNAMQLRAERARADKAERELKALNEYMVFTDSLHKMVKAEKKKLRTGFSDVIRAEDDGITDPRLDWSRQLGEFRSEIPTEFSRHVGDLSKRGVLTVRQIDILEEMFSDHHKQVVEYFTQRLNSLESEGMSESEFADELANCQSDCEDRLSGLNRDIIKLERDISKLEQKNERLNIQLGQKAGEPCPDIDCPDNSRALEDLDIVLSEMSVEVDNLDVNKKAFLGVGYSKKNVEKVLREFQGKMNKYLSDAERHAKKVE